MSRRYRGDRTAAVLMAVVVALSMVAFAVPGAAGAAPPAAGTVTDTNDLSTPTGAVTGGETLAQVSSGDVLYRVNAGGASVSAASGPDWTSDASGSQYSTDGSTYTASGLSASDIDNPTTAPSEVYLTERYDNHSWSFDVTSGQSYEIRLYFAEVYHGVSTSSADPGDRAFDVAVEGDQVLNDYDIVAETGGAAVATVETDEVTPSDGTLDVTFTTETDNAKVSAIEVVESSPEPGVLDGPSTVDFGTVVVGDTASETVTLSNAGESGDSSITVSDVSVTGTGASEFGASFSGSTTLAPGETLGVPVTFSPTDAQTKSASLEVTHDAPNTTSPLTVSLSGEGQSQTAVGFGAKDTVTSQVNQPTSVEFGPDGRLYVSERAGAIKVFNVSRVGEDSYDATLETTITTVQDLPNHDDDGSYNPNVNQREVTGLTVAGTASQPVIYVTSSDIRVGGGGSGDDTNLDTNSGVVSRLTYQSDGNWEHDMMMRGLPRSEENHAPNGLQYYTANGSEHLLVAVGGHTNQGAPSNNFAYTPEYALSAALVEINLTKIDAEHAETPANNTEAEYLYDLPTLQNTTTPFGGQDGENMAKLVANDGVSIFSAGYRNPYDVERTEDGQVYTVDNGPNGGWGGTPSGEGTDPVCTNEPNETDSESNSDNLHYATEGYYGGHPNPTRANPDGAGIWEETAPENNPQQIGSTAGAVYDGYDGSVECDYRPAGEGDGALWTNGASTNGMDEYTASNFQGGMSGDLLTAAFDGNVYRIQLTADGTDVSTAPTALLSPGNTPLDVEAVGDDQPYPGTIFVAEFGGAISVYEPNDYGSDTTTCSGADDPSLDEDGDGYDNADEIDAGTDPCSAGSTPADYDGDGTSNLNDPDDDDDGIDDVADEFAVDPQNGLGTTLPVEYGFERASVNDSLEGVGFTGLMLPEDGSTDYQDLYVPGDTVFGGANPALTIEAVKSGDATNNDQQHAYQFGVDAPDEEFVVDTTVTGFTDDPDQFESAGIFIGTGDQDNYRKLTVTGFGGGTSGEYGIQLFGETNGTTNGVANLNVSDSFGGSGTTTRLEIVVDPTTDPAPTNGVPEANLTGYYTIDDGERLQAGTTAIPTSWLDDDQGLAVGVVATSYQGDEQFSVTYNDLNVTTTAGNAAPTAAFDVSPSAPTVGEQVTLDASASNDTDGTIESYSWDVDGDGVEDATGQTNTTTFASAGTYDVTLTVADDDGETATTTQTVDVAAASEEVYTVNAGGSEYVATDGTTFAADPTSALVGSSQTYSTSNWASSPPEINGTDDDPLYRTERYGADFGYSVPVPENGSYQVTLQFAEIYQGTTEDSDTDADQTGQRVFDVTTEGQTALDDYDVYAEAGDSLTAVDETYTVEVTDGTLDIGFNATGPDAADNAKISAVKIAQTEAPSTSAEVTVTEGGGIDASTFSSGSFQLTNTGETSVTSAQIDLSESAVPDAVFDPNGTAGDATAKGIAIDSESGDGAGVVSTATSDVFSQPHNGVDDAEGYDALTLEFTDFEPGETVNFSTDVDPTTIKGASTTGGAGSVSGLELSGSAVTVTSSGATVTNDLYTDGSPGGSQANVSADASVAPTLGVEGVTLQSTDFPAHQAATVTDTQQTLTVNGPAGATVELLTVEASPPPADGFDVDPFEADSAEAVSSQTVTLDSSGQATAQVSLSESNLNYVQAAVADGSGSTGAVSETVILNVSTAPTGDVSADVALTPNSGLEASTYGSGSYQVTNTGGENIQTLRMDLDETLLPDMVFDPFNTAGDDVGKEFTLDSGDVTVETVEYTNVHNGQNNSAGYDSLVVTLSGFEPGETMGFSIDNDPTTISSTDLGSQAAGPVSGLELTGGNVSIGAGSTATTEATVVGDGSAGGAEANVSTDTDESQPTIAVDGVALSSTTLSDRHTAATVTEPNQTVTVTDAPANADVTVQRVEAELNLSNVPDPYEVEEYEGNKAVDVQYYSTTTDANGTASVDVKLTNSTPAGGQNYLVASVEEPDGDTGPTSDYAVLDLVEETDQPNAAPTIGPVTDQGVAEGESITVGLNASDADGDDLTYSVDGPSFVTADSANGTVTVAPGAGAVGTYQVTVTADDGLANASESFAVYVDQPDQDGTVTLAINAGGQSYTAADGTQYESSSNTSALSGGSTYSTSQAVGNTEDDTLYQTELYGSAPSLAADVENGTYEVTLQFAEIYQGVASTDSPDSTGPTDGTNENDRLFDATVEGQQVLTEYDIYSEVGPLNASDKTYTVEVTDGTLNVDLSAVNDNAKLSAVRVESLDANQPPTVDAVADQTVTEGNTTTVDVNASDPDGDAVSLSLGDAPAFASISNETVTLAPQTGDAGTYTVEVVADDGDLTANTAFQVTVEAAETGPGPVGDFENPPTDPDGDGVYEDVNGDGQVTSTDVTALFANLGDDSVQTEVDAFDVNGDGLVTSSDITALFVEVTAGGS